MRIAGVLGCGPEVSNELTGFDLVCYADCVEFVMEECALLTQLLPEDIYCLRLKLRRLHELRIIHPDIKPDNVAVSTKSGEPVFLDLGLSELLSEPLGLTSLTLCAGTLNYVA